MASIASGYVREGIARGDWHLSHWTGRGRPTLNGGGHHPISCQCTKTKQAEAAKISLLAESSGLLSLFPLSDAYIPSSCPCTSDSRFFGLWILRLALAASWGLSGLGPQIEGCTVGFPAFEAFKLGLSHTTSFSFPSLPIDYCGNSPSNYVSWFSLINSCICTYILPIKVIYI